MCLHFLFFFAASRTGSYCELFVFEILQDENLSVPAREAREILLRNFNFIQKRHPQEFPHRFESNLEDSSDDNRSSSLGRSAPSDDMSVASDYQEEGATEPCQYRRQMAKRFNAVGSARVFEEIPLVAAQDLSNILKQGYLEKKRRDHSFFSMEWQKRWCVLNNTIFYYFGSEKDKQQKGSFYINGYSAELVPSLRKDSKKNSCFEMSAPGRRSYQFTASSPREAREWVDQINFVLKDDENADITEEWNEKSGGSDYANYYQGLWDCEADGPDELAFQRGDLIYILSKLFIYCILNDKAGMVFTQFAFCEDHRMFSVITLRHLSWFGNCL
ncbi:src kinase-associated phospho 1-like protein [Labeo rohita]|uniref:Src kinase-associated phospho 1-like protein n=1 Tax=Labeo rohita TaxID=84645 RepID=A0A498LRC9_LABRO|nr:src kinase-associated phospho 1-like protein [Labeo rohita]